MAIVRTVRWMIFPRNPWQWVLFLHSEPSPTGENSRIVQTKLEEPSLHSVFVAKGSM